MNRFNAMHRELLTFLEINLPHYYHYHSPDHTRYVLSVAGEIAEAEGVSRTEKELILVAALFHDIGFVHGKDEHEKVSCTIARDWLKDRDFSQKEIDAVCGMIMATKIPQSPETHAEKILADADLEYLGTEHFYSVSQLLYKEQKHFQPSLSLDEWNAIQLDFMQQHEYHTRFCQKKRAPVKKKNMEKYL